MEFSGVTMTGGYSVLTGAAPAGDQYWANVSFLSETTSTNAQTNNTFLDSSSNNTITRGGTPTQGSFTPFTVASGASYSTATNGGSGYFNGSTDYLTAPASQIFNFGTGDFTIECWFNFSSFAGYPIPLSFAVGSASTRSWYVVVYPDGLPRFSWWPDGSNAISMISNTAVTVNTWNHIAVTRSAGTSFLFLNGQQVATVNTQSAAMYYNASAVFTVGREAGFSGSYVPGYISSARVVKGTAVYTGNFTPSTTPLTAISGTSVLLNFTNAGMYDATTKSNLTGFGTAQASTTQAKWSPTSAYFNGSSSYLYAQPNTAFAFGTGDFTVEGWVYFNSTSPAISALCQSDAIGTSTGDKWWFGYSGGSLVFACHGAGTPYVTTPFTPSTGTWYYITATRSSGTMYLFVNGVSGSVTSGNGTLNGRNLSQNGLAIGGISTPYYLNGYVQDLRLTKGVARYTTTFTPPTAALPTSA